MLSDFEIINHPCAADRYAEGKAESNSGGNVTGERSPAFSFLGGIESSQSHMVG